MFLAWAAYFEGRTDSLYFSVLLPRVLEDVLCRLGGRLPVTIADYPSLRIGEQDRSVESVAAEICRFAEDFHILFIHADTGGRALEAGIQYRSDAFALAANQLCEFELERAVRMAPRHETEAWALADPAAVCASIGFRGASAKLGLPQTPGEAERLVDPKSTLADALVAARGRRRTAVTRVMALIAQNQSLAQLRQMRSYREFEDGLLVALEEAGFLR